ncbi:uncharacterized protein LOC144153310 [Haemaphysalis longicornis]
MVFITHPRRSCCQQPCRVLPSSRLITEEDVALMAMVEMDSREKTMACLSFSMAVRVFHGAERDGTCKKEGSSMYTEICDLIQRTYIQKPGHYEEEVLYKFEDKTTIQKRIFQLYGKVKTLCAVAFDLDREDLYGNCGSQGPYPRVWAIRNAINERSGPSVAPTITEPEATTKMSETTPGKTTLSKTPEGKKTTKTKGTYWYDEPTKSHTGEKPWHEREDEPERRTRGQGDKKTTPKATPEELTTSESPEETTPTKAPPEKSTTSSSTGGKTRKRKGTPWYEEPTKSLTGENPWWERDDEPERRTRPGKGGKSTTSKPTDTQQPKSTPGEETGVLVCVVESVLVVNRLPEKLCTHLVYSRVAYKKSKEGDTSMFTAENGDAFNAALTRTSENSIPLLSEIEMSGFSKMENEEDLQNFLTSSTEWTRETQLDGLAFIHVPEVLPDTMFQRIVEETWAYLASRDTKMLLVGLDYEIERSGELVKSLTRKCSLMVFITHPRRSCCQPPCIIMPSSRRLATDDVSLMTTLEADSKEATVPCLSFSMAVRTFYGAKTDNTCSKEESSEYTKICDGLQSAHLKQPGTYEETNMYKFEDNTTIKERVSQLYGRVNTLCAVAFDLDKEDTDGSCASKEGPFPRVWAIRNAINDRTKMPWTSTTTEEETSPKLPEKTPEPPAKTSSEGTVTNTSRGTPWFWMSTTNKTGESPWWKQHKTTPVTHGPSASKTSPEGKVTSTETIPETSTSKKTPEGELTTEEKESTETPWWLNTGDTEEPELDTSEPATISESIHKSSPTTSPSEGSTKDTGPTTSSTPTSTTGLTSSSKPPEGQLKHALLCATSSSKIGNLLSKGLCTVLIYSTVTYDLDMQKFTFIDEDDFRKLQKLRQGTTPSLVVEVDTYPVIATNVRRNVIDFFGRTEEFLSTSNVDGLAFFVSHEDAIKAEPFAAELWSRSRKFKNRPLVIVMLEYGKGGSSQELAYSITGKCDYLVLVKHRRKPRSDCIASFPDTPLQKHEQVDMRNLERRSRYETTVCLSFTLAVFEFHGIKTISPTQKGCEEERWVRYDQVCDSDRVNTASVYEMRSKENGTELLTYEGERAIKSKVLKVHGGHLRTLCAAAFDVELEDVEGKCPAMGEPFARLQTLKKLISEDQPTSTSGSTTGMTTPPTLHVRQATRTVLCHTETVAPVKHLSRKQCDYIIYSRATYNEKSHEFMPKNDAEFKKLIDMNTDSSPSLVVEVDSKCIETLLDTDVDEFIKNLDEWIDVNRLKGIAIFTGLRQVDPKNVINNAKDIYAHFQNADNELKLIVSVDRINPFDKRLAHEFTGFCDFLILRVHPMRRPEHCAVDFPSRAYDEADFMLARQLMWEARGQTTTCFSINLAVRAFEVVKRREREVCKKETTMKYAEACNADIPHPLKNNTLTEIRYMPGEKVVVSFEGETSINHTMLMLYDAMDDLCISAFRVDLDDSEKECPSSHEPFPRLSQIKKLMRPKKITQVHSVEGATAPPDQSSSTTRVPHRPHKVQKYALLCVTKSADTLAYLIDPVCTHVIYSSVSREPQLGKFTPANEKAFQDFMALKKDESPLLLAEMEVCQVDPDGKFHESTPGEVADWLISRNLDGMAIFLKSPLKHTDKWVAIVEKIWEEFQSNKMRPLLVLGMDFNTEEDFALSERFNRKTDYLVLITHLRQPETPCKIGFPSRPTTEADTDQLTKLSGMSNEATIPCVTFNLAVRSFHLLKAGQPNDSCDEETWTDYAEVCYTTKKSDRSLYEMRYTADEAQLLTYEGKVFIQNKMSQLSSLKHGYCAAAFEVDRENPRDNCPTEGKPFSRLRLIGELLSDSRPEEPVSEPVPEIEETVGPSYTQPINKPKSVSTTPRGRSGERPKEAFRKFGLVCVAAVTDTLHYLLEKVCDSVVYTSVAYREEEPHFAPANDRAFHTFASLKKAQSKPKFLVEVDALQRSEALEKKEKVDDFVRALLLWLREKNLDGALLSYDTFAEDPETFKDVAQKLWEHIRKLPSRPLLFLGVNYMDPRETNQADELNGKCDLLVLITHLRKPRDLCKVGPPARIHTLQDSDYMARLLEASRNTTVPCVSTNLAVRSFNLGSRSRSGGHCVKETWHRYNVACGRETTKPDGTFEVARTPNETTLLTFESKVSIQQRMSQLLGEVPNFCVAAFGVEMEDAQNDCPRLGKPFSRLLKIKNLLGMAGEATYDLKKRAAFGRGRKWKTNRSVICIHYASGPAPESSATALCDYVVFAFLTLDANGSPVAGGKVEEFLDFSVKHRNRPVAALDPSFIDAVNAWDAEFLRKFSTSLRRWTTTKKWAGLALLPVLSTDLRAVADLSSAIWTAFKQYMKDPNVIIVGVHAFEADQQVLERLSRTSDFLIFINQEIKPPGVCRMHYPALRRLVYNDFVRMSNISGATATGCLSINLAVLGFRMAGSSDRQARVGDRCIEHNWSSFAEVCPSGDEEETVEPGLEGLVKGNKTYVVTFESRGTTYDKVAKFLQAYPDGCIAAFGFNFDDLDGRCTNNPPFPRVRIIADVLSKKKASLLSTGVKYEDELRKHADRTRIPLLCVISDSSDLTDNFPGELCSYLVYSSIVYSVQRDKVVVPDAASFKKFKHLPRNSRTWMLAAMTDFPWLEKAATRSVFTNFFIKATKRWIVEEQVQGIALLPEDLIPPTIFLEFTKRTYLAFKNKKPSAMALVVGVPAKERYLASWKKLSRFCDVMVFNMHRSGPDENCQVRFPSVEPFSSRHLEEMADISRDGRNNALVCMSVNLAVQRFHTNKRAGLGDLCTREEWEDYSQVCNTKDQQKWIAPTVNWEWVSAISSNATVTKTFEIRKTLAMKATQYLRLNPNGCLAVFNVDYDDPYGACTEKEPFPRLTALANLKHTSGLHQHD